MARGNWEDFTSKWGFNDGESLEDRDFRARDILVRLINKQPEMKAEHVRALAFDRPGVHNACLILFAKDLGGRSDEELLGFLLQSPDVNEAHLPDDMEVYVGDLIDVAYRRARYASRRKTSA